MLMLRYAVHTQRDDAQHYCVWDTHEDQVAQSEEHKCRDLSLTDAFKLADELNRQAAK